MAHKLAVLVYRMLRWGTSMSTKGCSTTKNDTASSKSAYSKASRKTRAGGGLSASGKLIQDWFLESKMQVLGSQGLRAGSSDGTLVLSGTWRRIVQRLFRVPEQSQPEQDTQPLAHIRDDILGRLSLEDRLTDTPIQ